MLGAKFTNGGLEIVFNKEEGAVVERLLNAMLLERFKKEASDALLEVKVDTVAERASYDAATVEAVRVADAEAEAKAAAEAAEVANAAAKAEKQAGQENPVAQPPSGPAAAAGGEPGSDGAVEPPAPAPQRRILVTGFEHDYSTGEVCDFKPPRSRDPLTSASALITAPLQRQEGAPPVVCVACLKPDAALVGYCDTCGVGFCTNCADTRLTCHSRLRETSPSDAADLLIIVELCDSCNATKGGRPFFTRTVNHRQGSRKWKATIDGTLHSDSEVEERGLRARGGPGAAGAGSKREGHHRSPRVHGR